jgi:protein TonB
VQYVVNKDGKVQDVTIVRSADDILDAAALKHIQNMPDMAPGKQRGKAVSVQFIVPINFQLSR